MELQQQFADEPIEGLPPHPAVQPEQPPEPTRHEALEDPLPWAEAERLSRIRVWGVVALLPPSDEFDEGIEPKLPPHPDEDKYGG